MLKQPAIELYSIPDALRAGAAVLQSAHIASASLDARLLLQHVMHMDRETLMREENPLDDRQYQNYMNLITQRASRKPVAQLTGQREFWDLTFKVTEATLDPRPDSETLIEAVLARFPHRDAPWRILDLGTGTGCLLLTLLHCYPQATGLGIDCSEEALRVALANAEQLQLRSRSLFMHSCWGDQVEDVFDIVVSNPPYIPTIQIAQLAPEVSQHEPILALDGGLDGLDCYRILIPQLKRILTPEGQAFVEIGMGQQKQVETITSGAGLHVTGIKNDLAGTSRCVIISNHS